MKWFRTWSSDYLTDPIISQLSLAQRGFYTTLQSLASERKPRGMIAFGEEECCRMVARCMRIRRSTARNMLQRLQKLELIEIDQQARLLVISDWNDKQFESDDATKRNREWREAQRFNQ